MSKLTKKENFEATRPYGRLFFGVAREVRFLYTANCGHPVRLLHSRAMVDHEQVSECRSRTNHVVSPVPYTYLDTWSIKTKEGGKHMNLAVPTICCGGDINDFAG